MAKTRERKKRTHHQTQQGGQTQGQGTMTHISGVRKVSQTPGLQGCSVSRFGVKTDQEDLLSKVLGKSILYRGILQSQQTLINNQK